MKTCYHSVFVATVLVAISSSAFAQDSFGGQQPGGYPQQPGVYPPPQPGSDPQQPGAYPPGSGYPQQPGRYPPQQPGGYPQQPGGYLPPQPGGYPQQPGGYPPSQPGGYPQPGPGAGGPANLDQMERQDFGVPPTAQLHSGPMHGPTPASIPGGQIVTTKGLVALVQGKQAPYFLFDVLGGSEILPGAMPTVWVAQAGSFNDQIQQQFSQLLQQGTQGRKDIRLIFYCLSPQCWMSYNAALRAINAGYTNVLWYRGGIEAWKLAGLPTQPGQQGYAPQQQGGYGQQPQGPGQQGGYPD